MKSLFVMFVAAICSMFLCACNRTEIYANPQKIIRRELVSKSSDEEVWRTSTYQLVTVAYDTISKRNGQDTAHELPR